MVTNRRQFVAGSVLAGSALASLALRASGQEKQRYRIGVCDWMILKRQKLGAIGRAQDIGCDGLELDMGSLGNRDTFESQLSNPETRERFLQESVDRGIELCSIAMSGFYAQSFAERPTYLQMVGDCITTMQQMSVTTAFLPLGVKGDLVKFPELRSAVVKRLREVGERAADAGVVIGVETALDAVGEAELLDEIDSKGIKIYFNFANALQAGRDLVAELRTLGAERICQIHCTDEDGVLLQDNQRLDMPLVRQTLDDMGWHGWLVMERSRKADDARNVIGNYGSNAKYLKSIFQT